MTLRPSNCECLELVRANILSLEALESTRSYDESESEILLLDLNENAFGPCIAEEVGVQELEHQNVNQVQISEMKGLSRYPAADQPDLKSLFCNFRNAQLGCTIRPANICYSAGLDDIIDIVTRCLCRPGDYILTCPPHYHMYATCAMINDVSVVTVSLDKSSHFRPQLAKIREKFRANDSIKVCFLCSPGNPTGYSVPVADITAILDDSNWRGVLVVDEAYVDFASDSISAITLLQRYPRLVVLQTLSKAFGLASIRLGFAIACEHLTRVFNNVRKPYAVSGTSIALAKAALIPPSLKQLECKIQALQLQKDRLCQELPKIDGIGLIRGGPDTNFILFEVLDALGPAGRPSNIMARRLSSALRSEANILVRYKGHEYGCEGCVRVTVGTPVQMDTFLEQVSLAARKLLQHGAKI